MRVRWYATDLPFLEGPSLVNNRIFDAEDWLDRPIGEVPLWRRQWKQKPYWVMPAGLTGNHVCHPEWIAAGEPWPVTLPDTAYDADWIPACCGRAGDPTEGGVSIGGSAGDAYRPPDATEGGMVIGGAVGDVWALTDGTSGGLTIGGSAGDAYSAPDPTEGGVSIGGSAGDAYRPPDATEGGVELGGEVGDAWSLTDPTEGGGEIGGSAGDAYRPPDATEGGVEIGGEAGDQWEIASGEAIYDTFGSYSFEATYSGTHLIRCYGAGGGGANGTSGGMMSTAGGGGGGGAEADIVATLSAGTFYTVTVGKGGVAGTADGTASNFLLGVVVFAIAAGGKSAVGNVPGAGGLNTASTGTHKWSGGNGFGGPIMGPGGGGGSSAMYSATGSPPNTGITASGQPGGNAPLADGGDGGNGGNFGAAGQDGFGPGGGGGGGGAGGGAGGKGHDGKVWIVWPPP